MKICAFENCGKQVKGRGYCPGHLRQLKAGGVLKVLRHHKPKNELPGVCSFSPCGREVYAKSLCGGHYQQQRTGHELAVLNPRRTDCSVLECKEKHYCQGYCEKHYKRRMRSGDVTKGHGPSKILDGGNHLVVEIKGRSQPGGWFMVDCADRHFVEGKSFNKDTGGYAHYWNGKRHVFTHRELLGEPEGLEVDHINGNRLDNRRSNLRVVTFGQQMQNKKPWAESGHRNVHKLSNGSWRVVVVLNGVKHYGGIFARDDIQAAIASAAKLRGELFTHANEERVNVIWQGGQNDKQ